MRHSCGAGDQRGYKRYASFIAPATITAVLHFVPVLGPLLAPLKGQMTALAGFRFKTILGFSYAGHGLIVGECFLIGHAKFT